jgi:hypothetical protein
MKWTEMKRMYACGNGKSVSMSEAKTDFLTIGPVGRQKGRHTMNRRECSAVRNWNG